MRTRLVALTVLCAGALGGCSSADDSGREDSAPSRTVATPSAAPTPTLPRAEATALLWRGVKDGRADVVRRAVAAGADLEARGRNRATPLVAATKRRDAAVARVLLEAGADPDAKDAIQDSAFLYAGAEGLDEILALTMRHGADARSLNRFRGTALIPASEHAHVEAVRMLLRTDVPVNHVNDFGWTALHEAVVLGNGDADHVRVVRMLLAAGADRTIRGRDGRTPRQQAVALGFTAIVQAIDDAV